MGRYPIVSVTVALHNHSLRRSRRPAGRYRWRRDARDAGRFDVHGRNCPRSGRLSAHGGRRRVFSPGKHRDFHDRAAGWATHVALVGSGGPVLGFPEHAAPVDVPARGTRSVVFEVTCSLPTRARIAFVRRSMPGRDGMPGTPSIYVANADGTEAARLTGGESPAWSLDGRRIAFNRAGTIYIVDADGSEERPIHRGLYPAWSPDGARIVFATQPDDAHGGISVINVDGSSFTRLIGNDFATPGTDEGTGWPQWSPDGRRISFVRTPAYDSFEPWAVYIMNADGSDPRPLPDTRTCAPCTFPYFGWFQTEHTWSPDGSRIASGVQALTQEGELSWAIATATWSGSDFRAHYLDQAGGYAGHPDWSPDGSSVVFEKYMTTSGCEIPSCPMRVFLVSTEGGGPARQLIPEMDQVPAYWDHQPAWSRVTD